MTWLADVVLAALGLEAAVLLAFGARRGLPRVDTAAMLLPGAALVVALRVALAGGGVAAIGLALLAALAAHGVDLARRWRRR